MTSTLTNRNGICTGKLDLILHKAFLSKETEWTLKDFGWRWIDDTPEELHIVCDNGSIEPAFDYFRLSMPQKNSTKADVYLIAIKACSIDGFPLVTENFKKRLN